MGDTLIALTGSGILALESSFAARWAYTEPARSAVLSNDGLFALTREPALMCVNPRNGAIAWSRPIGRHALPQLAVAEDRVVYVIGSVVVALSNAGTIRWVYSAPRRIIAGPVACGASVLAVADRAGIVYILNFADGKPSASYSALPIRPIALAGSPNTVVCIGMSGDVLGIDLAPQA